MGTDDGSSGPHGLDGIDGAAATLVDQLAFDDAGLIPVVVQDHDSREVLMVAWMNAESVAATLHEGRTVFWSRSRQQLWRKGETSGHVQQVRDLRVDCDADTILVTVDQVGAACHTGERTCFHRRPADLQPPDTPPVAAPESLEVAS